MKFMQETNPPDAFAIETGLPRKFRGHQTDCRAGHSNYLYKQQLGHWSNQKQDHCRICQRIPELNKGAEIQA